MQTASAYGMALVKQIETMYPLSEPIRKAFLAVPRHVFLEPYEGNEQDRWLHEVYQDNAIVTKRNERGTPLSSSSQPSIMAWMLEALEVREGMKVLEIGTGTGYNAALLAQLTGDPAKVTTIDIDPELTARASSRLESVVGPGTGIVTGDGALGVPERAPYDRIIATASAFPVPPAWIAQLALGGRLVLDLRGTIGGGLMVVTKQTSGNATGHFLAVKETISFMGLRATTEERARTEVVEIPPIQGQRLYAPGTVEHACASHFSYYQQFRGEDDAFNVWVQCVFPSLSIKWFKRENRAFVRLLDGETQTTLIIEQHEEQAGIVTKGGYPLWEEIVQTYQKWVSLGKPGRAHLVLVITSQRQEMKIVQKQEAMTLSVLREDG